MAEELIVNLKRNENIGFGFSLLGTKGLPHVIYDIEKNSPAAECGEVEAGDVIIKVNGTDVHRLTTKEVLKCLRLSEDPVTLELKRDPKIKSQIKKYLAQTSNLHSHHYTDIPKLELSDINIQTSSPSSSLISSSTNTKTTKLSNLPTPIRNRPQPRTESPDSTTSRPSRIPQAVKSPAHQPTSTQSHSSNSTSDAHSQSQQQQHIVKPKKLASSLRAPNGNYNNSSGKFGESCSDSVTQPPPKARFEAYMMTGDLILNLSRTPQTSILSVGQKQKADSLRDSPHHIPRHNDAILAPRAKYDSSPSSSSLSDTSDTGHLLTKQKDDCNLLNLSNLNNSEGETSAKVFKKDTKDDNVYANHYINNAVADDGNSQLLLNLNKKTDKGCVIATTVISTALNNKNFEDTFDSSVSALNINTNIVNKTDSIGSSSSTVRGDLNSSPEISFSVPVSPTQQQLVPDSDNYLGGKRKESSNSVPTSPEISAQQYVRRPNQQQNGMSRTCDASGFRTSRSEDHLQASQKDGLGAVVSIDIDEDVNSSLNTLLDTRHDSEDSQCSDQDRIVWTYNAPVIQTTTQHSSRSSSLSSHPRSDSPASPTSVSSSVMSSNSSSNSKGTSHGFSEGAVLGAISDNLTHPNMCPVSNTDQSVSEALSNISSPDYQDDDNLLSARDSAMAISDPSDSDSTILVSETKYQFVEKEHNNRMFNKVKSSDNQSHQGYSMLRDSEDELATLIDDGPGLCETASGVARESSPTISDDGSDVESLHSYHYSPKAVDIPSAVRLAKRLYGLEGFKKSDVSRHLSKNNDFSRAVAEEYLRYFSFEKISLDEALRQFLQQFSLSGETQERERVLVHFSKRFLDCNPNCFNSQDAVHTLTCAIMLLNTDLHGQNIGRRMTCSEFIENLVDLNDGENFPKDVLKYLYQAIKSNPLQWALDEDYPVPRKTGADNSLQGPPVGPNPFIETLPNAAAVEYKKGYVMRKSCYDSNNKKTPFGKRSWKMYYCTLRDLVLYLHKDENGFRKSQISDNVHNAVRLHHALATRASDYTKKQHVFRLQTADQAEYLFQTSDSKELQSWIDTINFVCASFSAPPLEGGVGSQEKRFQRPLLPSSHTKLLLKDQLKYHEQKIIDLNLELERHRYLTVPSKGMALQYYREKDAYLQYEIKRFTNYVAVLKPKVDSDEQNNYLLLQKTNDEMIITSATINSSSALHRNNLNTSPTTTIQSNFKLSKNAGITITHHEPPPPILEGNATAASCINGGSNKTGGGDSQLNRYSYRAAIYQNDTSTSQPPPPQQQQHELG